MTKRKSERSAHAGIAERPHRSGIPAKGRAAMEPGDPPQAHAATHRPHDPKALVWAPRSDVGTMTGDVYQIRFTEESYEKYAKTIDPTKRTGIVARKMRIRSDVGVPSKAELATAFKIDFETFWRKLEGVSLVGSRGKTIEEVADNGS